MSDKRRDYVQMPVWYFNMLVGVIVVLAVTVGALAAVGS